MSLETEVRAIRLAVALSELPGRVCLRLAGKSVESLLNRICPCDLFIRDGQMQQTLFLNDDGNPLADVFVCADGEDFLLLAEGLTAIGLTEYLRTSQNSEEEIRITDLTSDHSLLSLNGPYAWELLSEVISTEIIGLPFSAFYHGEDFTCFRTSATGEFSYELLIPRDQADKWRERILKIGKVFDLENVGAEALRLCALENFVFNIHADAIGDVTPLELQLQWRVSYKKTYPGSAALLERRKHYTHRAVLVAATAEMKNGDRVRIENRDVGILLNTGYSFDRKEWLGLALVDRDWAYSDVPVECMPGITGLIGLIGLIGIIGINEQGVTARAIASQDMTAPAIASPGTASPARIISAPAINNRSLFVDPQRHTYAGRGEKVFPSLIHGWPQ